MDDLGLDRNVKFRDLYVAIGVFAFLVALDKLGHEFFTLAARARLDKS